ncbi:MAG: hypothetical protein ACRCTF_09570 [Bacteroidales bacterium]
MKIIQILILLSLLTLTSCWGGEVLDKPNSGGSINRGEGVISYSGYKPLASKPIKVHYFIPEGDMNKMPILFVLPGLNRNAADYLQAWKSAAQSRGVMVFSLEFPASTYPSSDYTEGAMFANSNALPEEQWSFSIIDPLFSYICKELSTNHESYDMWGHSAGAQFVHRYLLFKSGSPINRAMSANAGWYTLPDFNVDFPYGLKGAACDQQKLTKAFASKLILQLGTADNNVDDPNLNHSAGADNQGLHRYERGLYFWSNSSQIADDYSTYNWSKVEVEGVGHSYSQMAASAASTLY